MNKIDLIIKGRSPKYKVGLISDVHFDVGADVNGGRMPDNGSDYEDDTAKALDFMVANGVDFFASCGDFARDSGFDLGQAVPPGANAVEKNKAFCNPTQGFAKTYREHALKKGKRLFTCLGNHDMKISFEEDGSVWPNQWQFVRYLSLGLDYNPEAPREPEDLNYFEWDTELYPRKNADGAYTQYTNTIAKQSYWVKIGNELFIFLSPYYGLDRFSNSDATQENPTNWIDTTSKDKYIQIITEYAKGDGYDKVTEMRYDYQFYFPQQLVWLKDVIEHHKGLRPILFTHYFLPNRAGNGSKATALQADGSGGYFYSKNGCRPMTFEGRVNYNNFQVHANSLCGVEFHFLNRLLNEHPEMIVFGGHSHFLWSDAENSGDKYQNFCCYDFDIIKPSGNEVWLGYNCPENGGFTYLYSRSSESPRAKSALTVHLPSLTRPSTRGTDGNGMYQLVPTASDGAVMTVFDDGILIEGYSFKSDDNVFAPKVVVRAFYDKENVLHTDDGGDDTDITTPSQESTNGEVIFRLKADRLRAICEMAKKDDVTIDVEL